MLAEKSEILKIPSTSYFRVWIFEMIPIIQLCHEHEFLPQIMWKLLNQIKLTSKTVQFKLWQWNESFTNCADFV